MNGLMTYLGISVSIVSLTFALWQWKQREKIKHIQLQNLRSIWDLSRSYVPYKARIESIIKDYDQKEVISEIKQLTEGISAIVRFITPLYARSLNKNLTYDYIRCMMLAGEIGSAWSLKLLLMEIPIKKRNQKIEAELIEELPKCLNRIRKIDEQTKKELKIKRFKMKEKNV